MKISRINFMLCFVLLPFTFYLLPLYAMDVDLWSLPQPQGCQILWKDKSAEVNNINLSASQLICKSTYADITQFYQDALKQRGWQLTDDYPQQGIMGFTKDEKFIYLAVLNEEPERKVYLVSSPRDLHLCRTLVDYFLKEEVAADAEGKDIPDIPRCPSCRRRMNIFTREEGAFILYETDANPQEIGDFYQKHLGQSGWELMQGLKPELLNKFTQAKEVLKNITVLLFERNEDTLLITAYPTPREAGRARTLVSITKNFWQEIYPEAEE